MYKTRNILTGAVLLGLLGGMFWFEGNRPDTREDGEPLLREEHSASIRGLKEYWRTRLGELPENYLMEARRQADRLPQTNTGPDKDGGLPDWTWLGPGNVGGRVRAFVIDPANSQRMWLGGVSGGIWRSTDGGSSWAPVNDFMASLGVASMAITPDRQYLFAGTGEGYPGGLDFLPGAGVFRSADLGLTWQQLPQPDTIDFQFINRIAVHPTIDGRLYVVTGNGALYRSDDDGMTWSLERRFGGIGFDVKITDQTASGTPWIVVGGNNEAFLSKDDGLTFTSMVNGGIATPLPAACRRVEFAFGTNVGVDPVIYASISQNNGELWRSTDGGENWILRNTGNNIFLVDSSNQGRYDNSIWVEPGNSDRLVWGGIEIWKSTDGGLQLTKASHYEKYKLGLSAHADNHLILPHPNYSTSNPVLYFANDGGVQRSSDIWTSDPESGWTNLANGLGITQFNAGAAAEDNSVVMGGARDNSILRYTNAGTESWFQAYTGDGAYCGVDKFDNSLIYGSNQNLYLVRSRDGGNNYVYIGDHIPDTAINKGVLFLAPFMVDKHQANALMAGGKRIWRSTDQGDTWGALRDSLDTAGSRCSAMEQSETNATRLYVGYVKGIVSRTTTSPLNWIDVQDAGAGMPAKQVNDIAINPVNESDVIVAFSSAGGDALWRSFDAGATWSEISQSGIRTLPVGPINTVTFHPHNPAWIYVGTDVGVFASEDGGLNWSRTTGYPGSEGPANTRVMDLFWGGDKLYAATYGRGMYVSRPLETIFIDIANVGGANQDGSTARPYESVGLGESAAGHGTNRFIEGGTYDETNGLTLKRRGVIKNRNGTAIIK